MEEQKKKKKKKDKSLSYTLFSIPRSRGNALAETAQDAIEDNFPNNDRDATLSSQWKTMFDKVMSISKDENEQKWLMVSFGIAITQRKQSSNNPLEMLIKQLMRNMGE